MHCDEECSDTSLVNLAELLVACDGVNPLRMKLDAVKDSYPKDSVETSSLRWH
jgi:hypothetical protein